MKRVLVILAALVVLFCLASCSDGLAGLMEKMSHNIYGIKADVSDASEAADKVGATKNEDGTVSIDYSSAASIIDSIQSLKKSNSNMRELKRQLSEPVFTDQADIDALKASLGDKAKTLAKEIGSDATGVKKTIRDAVLTYSGALTDVPAKSEIAVLAVLDSMASSVEELDGQTLIEEALKCAEALQVLCKVGEIDVLGDTSINNLVGLFTGSGSDSRAEDDNQFRKTFGTSLQKLIRSITNDDGSFNEQGYNRLVMESLSLKAAYDLTTRDYEIDFFSLLLFGVENRSNPIGLKAEDFGRYLICGTLSMMAEFDNCLTAHGEIIHDPWRQFVKGYVTSNYDAFMGSGEFKAPNQDSFSEPMDYLAQLMKAAMPNLGFLFEYDTSADYETRYEAFSEGLQILVFEISLYFMDEDAGGLPAYIASLGDGEFAATVTDLATSLQYDMGSELKSLYVIMVDTGYGSLLNGPIEQLQAVIGEIMDMLDSGEDFDYDDILGDGDEPEESDPLPLDFKEEGENFLLGYGAVSEGFDMEGFRVAFTAAEDEDTVVPVEIGGKNNVYWYGYDSDYTFYTMKDDSLMVYSEEGWENYLDENVQSIRAALFNPFVESILYGIYEEGFGIFERDESSDETVCERPCSAYWVNGRDDIDVILVDENYGFLAKTVSNTTDVLYKGYTLTSVEIDSTTLPAGYDDALSALE